MGRSKKIVQAEASARPESVPRARCLRHSLLIRQPICVRAATRTMTARLG